MRAREPTTYGNISVDGKPTLLYAGVKFMFVEANVTKRLIPNHYTIIYLARSGSRGESFALYTHARAYIL